MMVVAVRQGGALIGALRTLPPVVEIDSGLIGLGLMGLAIAGFGTLALAPPAATAATRARTRRADPRGSWAQGVVLFGLGCLILFPLLTIALRVGTADYLGSRGYRREIVNPGFHARFMTIRWSRSGTNRPSG